jgi:DNA-binding NarL/FixJ family response regulator
MSGSDKFARVTPRQLQIWEGVARGKMNKEIARDLGISDLTIKLHTYALFRKLNVNSRTQLALEWYSIDWRPK